jgi:hypothetical protein
LHDGSLYSARAQERETDFTEFEGNLRQQKVYLLNRAQSCRAGAEQQSCG